ncbi:hypothetical protein [uncultured Desulfuromonas sp.]|nr:hypothetical protein [uncultured Desulfuromonas sp.]
MRRFFVFVRLLLMVSGCANTAPRVYVSLDAIPSAIATATVVVYC